jgi:hypothetical protein
MSRGEGSGEGLSDPARMDFPRKAEVRMHSSNNLTLTDSSVSALTGSYCRICCLNRLPSLDLMPRQGFRDV